jgi:hypothetical protein
VRQHVALIAVVASVALLALAALNSFSGSPSGTDTPEPTLRESQVLVEPSSPSPLSSVQASPPSEPPTQREQSNSRPDPRRTSKPEVTTSALVEDGNVNGRYAFELLSSDFAGLADALAIEGQSDAEAQELRALYSEQIAALISDTDVRLSRLECGERMCAAEVVRPLASNRPDPFGNEDVAEWLPREGTVELAFVEGENAIRRFVFSADPNVTTLDSSGARR